MPFEELDDISKIAKQAMKFKSNLITKLQKQEELDKKKAETNKMENNFKPGPTRELKRFEIT